MWKPCLQSLGSPVIGYRQVCSAAKERFFRPTTGRWLWSEPQKLLQHTLRFDVEAIKNVVANIAGFAGRVENVEFRKLAEGGSNKVFIANVHEQRFIVKLPDPVVPRRLMTASEVATLEFLRTELNIPVPRVLAWSDNNDNLVGCEYIVMQEAAGNTLKNAWPSLGIKERLGVVKQIISLQKRLLQVGKFFRGYGSLYYASDATKFGFEHQIPVAGAGAARFSIGPLAHEHFMVPELIKTQVNCGQTPYDYLISIARSSLKRMADDDSRESVNITIPPFSFPVKPVSDIPNTAVRTMLEMACTAMPHIIPRTNDYLSPVLWHPDLHDKNIFVSAEGQITFIIDWQDVNVLPMFLSIRIPQFLEIPSNELLFQLPDGFKDMPPSEKKSDIWERYSKSMINGYYKAHFRKTVPAAAKIFDDEHINPLRKQLALFTQISAGHEADALMLRSTLNKIQRDWNLFAETQIDETASSCPIRISDDELERYYEDARKLNSFRDILDNSDINACFPVEGWVPVELFDEWKTSLGRVVKDIMISLTNQEERNEFKRRLESWDLTK